MTQIRLVVGTVRFNEHCIKTKGITKALLLASLLKGWAAMIWMSCSGGTLNFRFHPSKHWKQGSASPSRWPHLIDDGTRLSLMLSEQRNGLLWISVFHEPLVWIMKELLYACCLFTALSGCLFFVHGHMEAQQSPPNKYSPEEKVLICVAVLWSPSLPLSSCLQPKSSGFDRRQKRPGGLWLVRAAQTHAHIRSPLTLLLNRKSNRYS